MERREKDQKAPSNNEIQRRIKGIKRHAVDFSQHFRDTRPSLKHLKNNLDRIFQDGSEILAASMLSGVGADSAIEALGIVLSTVDMADPESMQAKYLSGFATGNLQTIESQIDSTKSKTAIKALKLVFGLNSSGIAKSDPLELAANHKDSLVGMLSHGNKDAGIIIQSFLEDERGRFPDDAAQALINALVERKISLVDLSVLGKFTSSQIFEFLTPALVDKKDDFIKEYKEGEKVAEDMEVLMVLGSLFGGHYDSVRFMGAIKGKLDDSSDEQLLTTLKRYSRVVGSFFTRDINKTYEVSSKKQILYRRYVDRLLEMRKDENINNTRSFINTFHDTELHTDPRIFEIKKQEAYARYSEKIPVLNGFGLDGAALFDRWMAAEPWTSYAVNRNIQAIESLERKRPGIALFLHKEYGITHFRRYPEELLLTNYDHHDDRQSSYGVVVVADSDYSGAMSIPAQLIDLARKTRGQHLVRAVEVASRFDLARKLVGLENRHGKIAFVVGGAHGDPQGMDLGKGRGKTLLAKNIQSMANSWRSLFVENPDFILHSCSTGEEGGIGQNISSRLDATVTAPWGSASVHSISFEDGKLSAKFDRRKVGHVFSAGELVAIV